MCDSSECVVLWVCACVCVCVCVFVLQLRLCLARVRVCICLCVFVFLCVCFCLCVCVCVLECLRCIFSVRGWHVVLVLTRHAAVNWWLAEFAWVSICILCGWRVVVVLAGHVGAGSVRSQSMCATSWPLRLSALQAIRRLVFFFYGSMCVCIHGALYPHLRSQLPRVPDRRRETLASESSFAESAECKAHAQKSGILFGRSVCAFPRVGCARQRRRVTQTSGGPRAGCCMSCGCLGRVCLSELPSYSVCSWARASARFAGAGRKRRQSHTTCSGTWRRKIWTTEALAALFCLHFRFPPAEAHPAHRRSPSVEPRKGIWESCLRRAT